MSSKSNSECLADARTIAFHCDRLAPDSESIYRLRFLAGRWLVYREERLIANFPAENVALALDFLRQKQSEQPARR
jgi:hypothetical protein